MFAPIFGATTVVAAEIPLVEDIEPVLVIPPVAESVDAVVIAPVAAIAAVFTVPDRKVRVWPLLPKRIVSDSPATPSLPIMMLPPPVVRLDPANTPNPMFWFDVALYKAPSPTAVLFWPERLTFSASLPTAVLPPRQ